MSAIKLPYGKPVKLLVDYQGFADGRLVLFEIWRRKDQKEEKVTDVYGSTKGGKASGMWIPLIEREEVLPLQDTIDEPEEEKYYFIAKIDDQEIKSGDMVFTYPLDIYVEDADGKPLDGVEYTVTFLSNGSKEEGEFKNGHAKFEDAPLGKFKIELEDYEFVFGIIIEARWGKNKAKCGEEVKMIADVKGFEDGTPAKFEIWKKDVDGKKEMIEEIDGEVQGDKVEAVWVYSPEEAEENLKKSVKELVGEPEFSFVIKIKEEEAKSGVLTFTYPLDIYLEDKDGNRLDDVEYIIIFSNRTRRKGRFKDGHAKIEDAPFANFSLVVEGYDFILE